MLRAPLPPQLVKGQPVRRYSRFTGTIRDAIRYVRKPNQFGRPEQLGEQHSRNLSTAVSAVDGGHFGGLTHLIDIGGGSGAFAIPLALKYPHLRITLVELPRALPHIRAFLKRHGVENRIELAGLNVHHVPWRLPECDGVLFGNFVHFCDDEETTSLLRESRMALRPGGRVLIHEMLWNERMDGPRVTALWNFWMTTISSGGQRSVRQFTDLLRAAGFGAPDVVTTTNGFSLLSARKPFDR
jgi:acetylserotonin N-methyltransferase